MTALPEKEAASEISEGNSVDSIDKNKVPASSERKSAQNRSTRAISWSSLLASTFSIFETNSSSAEKEFKTRNYGWTTVVKKMMSGGSMRRFQERLLGTSKADISSSTSKVWLLGTCYKVSSQESSDGENGLVAFLEDFSSRIWVTYRKGFSAIADSKLTSDVNWGCMIRCSQMLVAQAMLFHYLGRSWRKRLQKPYDKKYIEILHLFGDSEASAFSIHNLLHAGRSYGLSAGSWVGPYAMCRTWATLAQANRENLDLNKGNDSLPMVVYVVSGDEDGERGGAPVVYIDVAASLSSGNGSDQLAWAPILLLVPLVLGLEIVNPRYIPFLCETLTFPQSLGILGGKPGASTYIVGVQDDKALYLDPHEVQTVVDIERDSLEVDTSSYHCSTVRVMPLNLIDPSLAIGFYCRDKDDFNDFCARASELGDRSNGAPLFTVAQSFEPTTKPISFGDKGIDDNIDAENFSDCDNHTHEDEWQIL